MSSFSSCSTPSSFFYQAYFRKKFMKEHGQLLHPLSQMSTFEEVEAVPGQASFQYASGERLDIDPAMFWASRDPTLGPALVNSAITNRVIFFAVFGGLYSLAPSIAKLYPPPLAQVITASFTCNSVVTHLSLPWPSLFTTGSLSPVFPWLTSSPFYSSLLTWQLASLLTEESHIIGIVVDFTFPFPLSLRFCKSLPRDSFV